MEEERSGNTPRLILISDDADRDRRTIYSYTMQQWGEAQAQRYSDFLKATMQELANSPDAAPFVQNLDQVRSYTATLPRARQGHRIFYQEVEGGILILRILHTAMNWLERINEREN